MRHVKQRHKLGVKSAHRAALLSNLASALIRHGRIQTTLAKAKALRPFIEKVITLAKKANAAEDKDQALHYRRLAGARVRDKAALQYLFNEGVQEFMGREGGYTRIYKLVPRIGDAADMALIELIPASDEGYGKKKKASKKKKATAKPQEEANAEAAAEVDTEAEAETAAEGKSEAEAQPDSAAEAPAEDKPEAQAEADPEKDEKKD